MINGGVHIKGLGVFVSHIRATWLQTRRTGCLVVLVIFLGACDVGQGSTQASKGRAVQKVIDYRGNVAKFITYDSSGSGRVTNEQYADGSSDQFSYSLSGTLVTSATRISAQGIFTSMRFDASGYVLSSTDGLGQTTTILRSIGPSLALSLVGPCGCPQVTTTYDSNGNVLTRTDVLGQTESFQYEAVFSHVIQYTDKLGRITTFGYDSNGNLTSVTKAPGTLNLTTVSTYDSFGELTSITDPLGHATRSHYDSNGNPTAQIDPLGNQTTFQYDGVGRSTSVADPVGRITTMSYNALYVTSVTDPAGATTQFAYDANGNRTTVTDALQNVWTSTYDVKNKITSVTDPLRNQAIFLYNINDELFEARSPSGRTTQYEYDGRGQVTLIANPLLGTTNFTYDNEGDLVALTDQRGFTTSFTYDALFRLTGKVDPVGGVSSLTYDAVSNIVTATDRLGRQTTLIRDQANRLTQASYADAVVSYAYDAASRLTQVDDSQSGAIVADYDDANRVLSETTGAGVVSYTYNQAGQRASMTAASLAPVNYSYDSAGRLQTVSHGADTFTYSYDTLSRRAGLQRTNGVSTAYSYDNASRLAGLSHTGPLGVPIESLTYSYNLDGEIASIGSLTPPATPASVTFGQADAANRVPSVGSVQAQFNAEGQTVSKTDTTSGATTNYQWDARGRLMQVMLPGSHIVSYQYDAASRRIAATTNGVTTSFLYDGQDVVQDQGSDGSSTSYINGAAVDEKLEQMGPNGPLYFTQDRLGSTLALTDATGNVVERETYAPFGGTIGSALTRYGFTGRELDSQTGLMFYRARWYDPGQGRFMIEDPIGYKSGPNLYSYVGNNPAGLVDSSGLDPDKPTPLLSNQEGGFSGSTDDWGDDKSWFVQWADDEAWFAQVFLSLPPPPPDPSADPFAYKPIHICPIPRDPNEGDGTVQIHSFWTAVQDWAGLIKGGGITGVVIGTVVPSLPEWLGAHLPSLQGTGPFLESPAYAGAAGTMTEAGTNFLYGGEALGEGMNAIKIYWLNQISAVNPLHRPGVGHPDWTNALPCALVRPAAGSVCHRGSSGDAWGMGPLRIWRGRPCWTHRSNGSGRTAKPERSAVPMSSAVSSRAESA